MGARSAPSRGPRRAVCARWGGRETGNQPRAVGGISRAVPLAGSNPPAWYEGVWTRIYASIAHRLGKRAAAGCASKSLGRASVGSGGYLRPMASVAPQPGRQRNDRRRRWRSAEQRRPMAGSKLVPGRFRYRRMGLPAPRLGLFARGPALGDADLDRDGRGLAEDHRLPRAHQSGRAGNDNLDGWPASSARECAPHMERLFNGRMGRRYAGRDDHPCEGGVHPALGVDAERSDGGAHPLAAYGRLPAGDRHSVRPHSAERTCTFEPR